MDELSLILLFTVSGNNAVQKCDPKLVSLMIFLSAVPIHDSVFLSQSCKGFYHQNKHYVVCCVHIILRSGPEPQSGSEKALYYVYWSVAVCALCYAMGIII